MRTRDEETKPPNRNSLIFHCHTEYFTVYRARAHEFTRDQNKEKHDTPEKAASTCKPASTGKERPSRRSGKPKLARRAAVKEGEPSRPLYPLSLSHAAFPTLSLSLSPFLSSPSLFLPFATLLSLSPLSFSRYSVSLSTRCPPPLYGPRVPLHAQSLPLCTVFHGRRQSLLHERSLTQSSQPGPFSSRVPLVQHEYPSCVPCSFALPTWEKLGHDMHRCTTVHATSAMMLYGVYVDYRHISNF